MEKITAEDARALKMFLYISPPLIADVAFRGNNVAFGIAFVVGAIAQAIIPPRMKGFWPILGTSVAAMLISFFWKGL